MSLSSIRANLMHALFLKGPSSAVALSVLFSLLGMLFQPLIIIAAAGMALHFLVGHYRVAFLLLASSFTTIALISFFVLGSEDRQVIRYDSLLMFFFFVFPLIFSATSLSKTNNPAVATFIHAIFALLAVMLFNLFGEAYLQELETFLRSLTQQNAVQGLASPIKEEDISQVVAFLVPSMSVTIFIFLTVALFVARLWQSRVFNPGGFGREFRAFQLGKKLSLVLISLLGLSLLNLDQMQPLTILVLSLFVLQGLSLVHFYAKKKHLHQRFLVLFYILLWGVLPLFFTNFFVIVLALLALWASIDGWANFRASHHSVV